MRAIVIVSKNGSDDGMHPGSPLGPLAMLLDRPMLLHVVEYLVEIGVVHFDFVVDHTLIKKAKKTLGDMRLWGSNFRFHACSDSVLSGSIIQRLADGASRSPLLLAYADYIPQITASDLVDSETPAVFCLPNAEGSQEAENLDFRAGWAWLPEFMLTDLPDACSEQVLYTWLTSLKGAVPYTVASFISARSFEDLLTSHRRALLQEFTGLQIPGREVNPGVWISGQARLHAETELIGPVYIGEKTQIKKGVRLGPGAYIGSYCVIDIDCSVERALVVSGSYLGKGLELKDGVVAGAFLMNTRLQGSITVTDASLLGHTLSL